MSHSPYEPTPASTLKTPTNEYSNMAVWRITIWVSITKYQTSGMAAIESVCNQFKEKRLKER